MNKIKKLLSSLYWLKHVLLALIIIGAAVVVLIMQQNQQSSAFPEGGSGERSISSNMSRFFSNHISSSRYANGNRVGDFVMDVKISDTPLVERLKKMANLQKPVPSKWVGEYKHRLFKAGGTLRGSITNYAQSEGMQVIWELEQDFIVKYPFQLDDSLLGSLKKIGETIDPNFDGEVKTYMCPRQHSMVITSQSSKYLEKQCQEALP
jgi:hypothetical protein